MENDGQASLVLGTSVYLAHSGVKGMKWGVWNAETRARRTGQKMSDEQRAALKAKRKQERKVAALKAVGAGTLTAAKTGFNPILGSAAAISTYAGSRLSDEAIRTGKPFLDKHVKNPNTKAAIETAARITITTATAAGYGAVNALLGNTHATTSLPFSWAKEPALYQDTGTTLYDQWDRPYNPVAYYEHHSIPGSLLGTKPHEHIHANPGSSSNITEQLSSADIPESLLSKKIKHSAIFKVTTTSGESAYLVHSGVKGMKWGVWNAETRKRKTRISDTKPEPLGKTITTFVKKSAIDNISYDTAKLAGKRLIGNAAVKAALMMTANTVSPPVISAGEAAVALVTGNPVMAIAVGSAAVAGAATAGVNAYNRQKYKEKGQDEIRSLHLDKLDENVSKTNKMQKKASQKYGAESKQYKKAVKKYGKAKEKFQKEYDRLNPDY